MAGKSQYPIQTKMPLLLQGSPATSAIIQADRCASAVNHRLYRQSRMYHAKIDLDANAQQGTVVTVWALADTWWTKKAYQMAFDTFTKNSEEERAALGNTVARWNDFRVKDGTGFGHMLPAGQTTPTGSPVAFGALNTEYAFSEVHDAGGVTKQFAWTGSAANTFNIIDEYDMAGNTNTDPTTAIATASYDGLEDEIDAGQAQHLTEYGNAPPYNRTDLENGVWVKVATLVASLNDTDKLSTGYFKAPCGLIAITKGTPFTTDQTIINLELKSGDYKGIAAPSYLE